MSKQNVLDPKIIERIKKKQLSSIEAFLQLRICDNFLFSKYADSKECIQELLRVILQQDNLKIVDSHGQFHLNNVNKKESVLDCYAQDEQGNVYNVEVQLRNSDDVFRRALYYESLIRVNNTPKGSMYHQIKPIVEVFLCHFDVYKKGCQLYKTFHYVEDTKEILYNEGTKIFIDLSKIDDSDLGRLIRLIKSRENVEDEKFPYTTAFLRAVKKMRRRLKQWLKNMMM